MKRKTRLLDSQSPVEMQKKDLSYNKCNNKISLSSHAEMQVYQLQCPHVPLYRVWRGWGWDHPPECREHALPSHERSPLLIIPRNIHTPYLTASSCPRDLKLFSFVCETERKILDCTVQTTRIVYSADHRDCTKAANGNLATKHNFVLNIRVREMSVHVRGLSMLVVVHHCIMHTLRKPPIVFPPPSSPSSPSSSSSSPTCHPVVQLGER